MDNQINDNKEVVSKVKTRLIFCTIEQEDTEHEVVIDTNGDFVCTCECGAFIKIPGDFTKDEVDATIEAHKEENEGKVTLAALEKINSKKLENI